MVRTHRIVTPRVVSCAIASAAVLGAAVLSACGSTTTDAKSGSVKSVAIAYPYTPSALDAPTDVLGSYIEGLINDPLELSGKDNALTPQLATSVTTPDPKTIVYHLRPNVRFSNGAPLTAEDVAWSIRRTFTPTSQVGTYLPNFKSASVSGPNEVTVRLKGPTPAARGSMAFSVWIQNKAYAKQHPKNFGTQSAPPVGTGAYKVEKWGNDGVTLVRNDRYWGPKPPAQRIKFAFIGNDNSALLALRSGEIQGTWSVSDVRTLPQWTAIPGSTVYEATGPMSIFLSFDVTRPPFNDVHVRRAIAYAVDREGLRQAAFAGHATLLRGVFDSSGISSVAPSPQAVQQLLDELPQYPFDLDKAKAELAQSRYPNGFKMSIGYFAGRSWAQMPVLSMVETLGKIGIDLSAKPLQSAQYYEQQLAGVNRPPQIVQFGSFPEDPMGGLAYLVGKANAVPYGLNYANYTSAASERAWAEMTQSVDNSVRWQGVQSTMRQISDDLPYVPLFNAPQLVVLGDDLQFTRRPNMTDLLNGHWAFLLRG